METDGRCGKVPGQKYREDGSKRSIPLSEAIKATWPTPRAIYGEHPGMTDQSHLTGQIIGADTSGPLAQTENFAERLTTLSAWLMGYTGAYLQGWETRSFRKSRMKS